MQGTYFKIKGKYFIVAEMNEDEIKTMWSIHNESSETIKARILDSVYDYNRIHFKKYEYQRKATWDFWSILDETLIEEDLK